MRRNGRVWGAAIALAAYGVLHGAVEDGRRPPAARHVAGGTFWWSTVFDANAVDSSWTARASLPSIAGHSGKSNLPVMLWARCRANTNETTVWAHYHATLRPDNQHAGGEAYKAVTVRMDSSAGYTQQWRVSDYAQQPCAHQTRSAADGDVAGQAASA